MREFIEDKIGYIVGGIIGLGINIITHFFPNLSWILLIFAILGIVIYFISAVVNFIETRNIISSIGIAIFPFIACFGIIVIGLIGYIGKINIDITVKKFHSVLVEESKHFAVYVSKEYIENFSSDDKEKLQDAIEDIEKKYGSFVSIYGTDKDNNKKISVIIYDGEIDKSLSAENAKAYVRLAIKNTIFFDIDEFYEIRDTLLHELQHVFMCNRINLFLFPFYSFTEKIFGYEPAIYSSYLWFAECFSESIDCFNHFFEGRVYDKYEDKYERQYMKFENDKTSKPLMFYNFRNIKDYNYHDDYFSAESFMKYLYIKSNYDINIFKDILLYANKYNGIDSILKVTEKRFGINDWGNLLIDYGYNSLEYFIKTNTIRENDLKSYLKRQGDFEIISDKGDILKRGKIENIKLYSGMVIIVRDVFTVHENLAVKDYGEYKIIANKSQKYNNYIEANIIKGYRIISINKSIEKEINIGERKIRLKELPRGNGLKNIEGDKILVWNENTIGIIKVTNGKLKIIEKIPIYKIDGEIKKDVVYKIIEENYNDNYYFMEK